MILVLGVFLVILGFALFKIFVLKTDNGYSGDTETMNFEQVYKSEENPHRSGFKTAIKADSSASFLRAARSGNVEKVLEYLKGNTDINTSNANGLNALHLASKEGHVNIVSELLKRGANVNASTKKGNTALHIACLAGQEAVVKILIQSGANVNVQSQNGFTPLYMAAQENHDSVVRFLLANGANQSLATEDGFTPLAVALQQSHEKVVTILLENDAKGRVRLPALHIAAKKDDCKAADVLLQNDHNPDVTSKSGFTPLHIAAHYGNESIGSLLLAKGADINYTAKHQITPLHVASKWGKANMVSLLLEKGAKIDSPTRDGLTPLHCAARSGHDHVVDLLLEKGAPITAKTKNGLAPLHMASQGDHVDSARILLFHKAPVDDITVDFLTALHVAAHCGHVRVAKLLLDRKADPNARALNGFTPLHIACKKNRIKVVELLLKYGGSIEATTESGLTPLHVSAFMGNMNIVIFLIQHGADPNIQTVRGETPMHLAARANQLDIIRILLRNGASVDAKAREHQTPLHIAARLGNVDIVSLLIQNGAEVDATTKDMNTALHIAAKEGQEEVASVLLDNGASPTAVTKKGFTPLHLAAKYGNINVVRLLLLKDSPVDAQGKNGVTPLHVAAHYNHANVAQLLLEKGASPNATAKNGYTPLHIAAKKNQMDIATSLLEYGAQATAESKAGFTPLHLAAQEGHAHVTTLLIEHNADVNAKAKNGLTPIHLCAQEDRVNVAAILVKNDAAIDSQTNAGYTPLHVACHFGQVNMVRFLLQHGTNVNSITSHGYTPLHQAAQQGHTLIINILLEHKASPNALTNQGQTALSIANRLGYISILETLKVVTENSTISTTNAITEEKYKIVSPETMQETFMSDSEDEGEDTVLGDQSMRYLTVDEMKSLGDDSLPMDVTRDERATDSMLMSADYVAPLTVEEDNLSPIHVSHNLEKTYVGNYTTDNIDISRAPVHAGKLKWKTFLVSFMVDARGGAMRGCRHSGVRVIIPPRKASMPMRITCRYLRKEKLAHPPPLMEGEACASRILEVGPVGAKFLGPVVIEVPHFTSLRGKEREITILRSDNGEVWREHTLEATEEAVQDVLNESFEGEELNALEDLNTKRITRILTTDFPQYFALISRVKQEVHSIGPEGGMVNSTVVPQVQAIFPEGALTKKIKVGLQAQPILPELVSKMLGNSVGVSPIVTVEPRRRKFHKPITLTIPVPQAATKGMINQYSGDAPTLRLLCSITGGTTKAQWEDVTGSTPLTFVNDCVSFTTTVSARFWLMDCRQVSEVGKYAAELYREAIYVPFMARFVVFAKRYEPVEAELRVFCMTDDKEEKTLECQENFTEIAKSREVEVMEGKSQYLEFAGNFVPVTKAGEQLALNFQAFRENRLPFVVHVKDPHQDPMGRIAFMREPRTSREEPLQTPICNLNISLPDICKIEKKPIPTETLTMEKKYGFVEETGLACPELIHRADLRVSDIAQGLGDDWAQLADQLDIPESDVISIKKEYPNDTSQQALMMLRLWIHRSDSQATGNSLEKALRKIGREDIVNKCMFNVEVITDDVEKAVAKAHLDQSGFDTLKDELGSSRDTSLQQDISFNVSYDELDIMKEAESAEETSSESDSDHEKQLPSTVEKIPEDVCQVQQVPQKEVNIELFMNLTSQEEPEKVEENLKLGFEQVSALEPSETETEKQEDLTKIEDDIDSEDELSSFEELEKPLEWLKDADSGITLQSSNEQKVEAVEASVEEEVKCKEDIFETIPEKYEAEEKKWEELENLEEELGEEELSPFEELEKPEEQVKEDNSVLEFETTEEKFEMDQKWEKLEKPVELLMTDSKAIPLSESEPPIEEKEEKFQELEMPSEVSVFEAGYVLDKSLIEEQKYENLGISDTKSTFESEDLIAGQEIKEQKSEELLPPDASRVEHVLTPETEYVEVKDQKLKNLIVEPDVDTISDSVEREVFKEIQKEEEPNTVQKVEPEFVVETEPEKETEVIEEPKILPMAASTAVVEKTKLKDEEPKNFEVSDKTDFSHQPDMTQTEVENQNIKKIENVEEIKPDSELYQKETEVEEQKYVEEEMSELIEEPTIIPMAAPTAVVEKTKLKDEEPENFEVSDKTDFSHQPDMTQTEVENQNIKKIENVEEIKPDSELYQKETEVEEQKYVEEEISELIEEPTIIPMAAPTAVVEKTKLKDEEPENFEVSDKTDFSYQPDMIQTEIENQNIKELENVEEIKPDSELYPKETEVEEQNYVEEVISGKERNVSEADFFVERQETGESEKGKDINEPEIFPDVREVEKQELEDFSLEKPELIIQRSEAETENVEKVEKQEDAIIKPVIPPTHAESLEKQVLDNLEKSQVSFVVELELDDEKLKMEDQTSKDLEEPKLKPAWIDEPASGIEKPEVEKQSFEKLERPLETNVKPTDETETVVEDPEVSKQKFGEEVLETFQVKPESEPVSLLEKTIPDTRVSGSDSSLTEEPEEEIHPQLEEAVSEIKLSTSCGPATEEFTKQEVQEPTTVEEISDNKFPGVELKEEPKLDQVLTEPKEITTEVKQDGSETTQTETKEVLDDGTIRHTVNTVTKITVVHDLDQLPPEVSAKIADSKQCPSTEDGTHLVFTSLPNDKQPETTTISTDITLGPEFEEKKPKVDSHTEEKEWTETDESGTVRHVIQKKTQSTFVIKDEMEPEVQGQSENEELEKKNEQEEEKNEQLSSEKNEGTTTQSEDSPVEIMEESDIYPDSEIQLKPLVITPETQRRYIRIPTKHKKQYEPAIDITGKEWQADETFSAPPIITDPEEEKLSVDTSNVHRSQSTPDFVILTETEEKDGQCSGKIGNIRMVMIIGLDRVPQEPDQ
ncbi:uncharacterized protein LOC143234139 isoform X6 [Tachypleus tridentatus]|uniref:uncharacterized protein LOC143234139 isoform X6 n=1 Tax=Tachypleus tridentatus TaxID=6853 RepID=UPI003FD4DB8D